MYISLQNIILFKKPDPEMLNPEIIKYLYTFATFLKKQNLPKLKYKDAVSYYMYCHFVLIYMVAYWNCQFKICKNCFLVLILLINVNAIFFFFCCFVFKLFADQLLYKQGQTNILDNHFYMHSFCINFGRCHVSS